MKDHPLLAGAYDELATYLRRLPTDRDRAGAWHESRSARRLCAGSRRLAYGLKLLSWPGLVAGAALVVLSFASPARHWSWLFPGLQLFVASVQVKVFNALLDLEVPALQLTSVVFASALFASLFVSVHPASVAVPLGVGALYFLWMAGLLGCGQRAKLATLEWMAEDPVACAPTIEQANAKARALHVARGIGAFGDAAYRRELALGGDGPRLVPCGTGPFPKKNRVRVQVWQRDPRYDLSSRREFGVCCFLGGSQDGLIFDYMLAPSLTMLDMLSSKGRLIRVMLLACFTDGGEPALLANTVLGREGGLIGSRRADDRFVREQVLAYARHVGFRSVLWNLAPTNNRPRQFVDSLREESGFLPERVWARLTWERSPLKLEVFNRREPGDSLYVMLALEVFNLTDNWATRGRVLCLREQVERPFLPVSPAPVAVPERAGTARLEAGPLSLMIPEELDGERTRQLLTGLPERYPGLDLRAGELTVTWGAGTQLVEGDALGGNLEVHRRLQRARDEWRELLFSLALTQALLARLHPLADEELPLRVLDGWPRWESAVVDGLNELRADLEALGLEADPFVARLLQTAVSTRHDPLKAVSPRAIYAALQERRGEAPRTVASELLAATLADERKARKVFGPLDEERRPPVREVLVDIVSAVAQGFLDAEDLPESFGHGAAARVVARAEAFRKEAKHRRLELSKELRAKLKRIKARDELLSFVRGCESRIRKGPQAAGREALAELDARRPELEAGNLLGELARLRSLLRWAPAQRLIDRLNLDDLW